MDEKTIARFLAKVNPNGPVPAHCPELGPCHEWTASRNRKGYGQFFLSKKLGRSKLTYAHRFAFFIANGRWPEPLALHRCDNPSCVRASHLFEGDDAANAMDRDIKRRRAPPRGSLNGMSKITDLEAEEIRSSPATRASLARRFTLSWTQIDRIKKGASRA